MEDNELTALFELRSRLSTEIQTITEREILPRRKALEKVTETIESLRGLGLSSEALEVPLPVPPQKERREVFSQVVLDGVLEFGLAHAEAGFTTTQALETLSAKGIAVTTNLNSTRQYAKKVLGRFLRQAGFTLDKPGPGARWFPSSSVLQTPVK